MDNHKPRWPAFTAAALKCLITWDNDLDVLTHDVSCITYAFKRIICNFIDLSLWPWNDIAIDCHCWSCVIRLLALNYYTFSTHVCLIDGNLSRSSFQIINIKTQQSCWQFCLCWLHFGLSRGQLPVQSTTNFCHHDDLCISVFICKSRCIMHCLSWLNPTRS